MSAVAALDAAERAGVEITVDGATLRLQADAPPPAEVLDLLRRHKAEIILLVTDSWSPEEWRGFYDERAALREHDGRASHAEAEAGALKETVAEWLARHLRSSSPISCVLCRDPETEVSPLLPFIAEGNARIWAHRRCWPIWRGDRDAEATTALARIGLPVISKEAL